MSLAAVPEGEVAQEVEISPEEVIGKYKGMRNEIRKMAQKVAL